MRRSALFTAIAALTCAACGSGRGADAAGDTGDDAGTIAEVTVPDATVDVATHQWPYDHPWTGEGFIRDELGRVLILRGANLANASKGHPFFPDWLEPDSFDTMARAGFNVVRLLIFWEAVEPVEGEYDEEYLDRVDQVVGWAGDAGVLVILDMHQDVWGRRFGEDGAPAWATLDDGIPFDPAGPWWMGYTEPAVIRAFDSFWSNRDGIRDKFVAMWKHVAARFADDARVIGYDLLNEPFQGSFPTAGDFCAGGLNPLYDSLTTAIREVDDRHLLFMEPSILTSVGMESCVSPAVTDGVVLAPHFYDPLAKLDWDYDGDPSRIEAALNAFAASAGKLGVPWFLGEWGFVISGDGASKYYRDHTARLDPAFANWAYYSLDRGGGMNLLEADGTPRWNMDLLTSVSVRRIAGRPLFLSHGDDGTTVFEFEPWPGIGAPTEVFVPSLRFPHGFEVVVAGGDATTEDTPGGTLLKIEAAKEHEVGEAPESSNVRLTLSPKKVPTRYGLSSHLSTTSEAARNQELELDAEAGLRLLRRDFKWSRIEPEQGTFVFDEYDATVDDAADHGVEMLGLLDYGNDWAYGTPGQDSTLDPDAFAAFAGECAAHFRGKVHYWEVWNEENTSRFWWPDPDPFAYGRLLKRSAAAIRAECPECTVVFGGLAPGFVVGPFWLWGFLEEVYGAHPDLNRYFDVLAIHPYTAVQMAPPEDEMLFGTMTQSIGSARSILASHGASKPIWITEVGWPAAPDPPDGPEAKPVPNVPLSDQAGFLARAAILSAAAGVDIVLWYTTYDGSAMPAPTSEDYFGLLQHDKDPTADPPPKKKPSWFAARAMTSFLSGRTYAGEAESPAEGVFVHRFGAAQPGDEGLLAAWSPGGEATLTVRSTGSAPVVTDHLGGPVTVSETGGDFVIPLGQHPVYVVGDVVIP